MTPRRSLVLGLLAAACLFAWLFYSRYWLWRDCIRASAPACTTPDGAQLTSGGLIWGVLAAGCAAAALRVLIGIPWRRSSSTTGGGAP